MYKLARALQLIGLIMLPLAVAGNLAELAAADNRLSLGESLFLSGIGILCFMIGYFLQTRVKPG